MDSTIVVAMIGAGVTVCNILLTNFLSCRKKENEREMAIARGVQCLLRAEIIRVHREYIKLGYCPIFVKEALTIAYKSYRALGGNDVATELYHECMELPNEPPSG